MPTKTLQSGTIVKIEGKEYVVLERKEDDKYLERFWYSRLSIKMKTTIQEIAIQQKAFDSSLVEQKGKESRIIVRHVFLPGLDEIMNATSLKDKAKFRAFLNNENIWTRDVYVWKTDKSVKGQQVLYLNAKRGNVFACAVQFKKGIRPAFVIDLFKINYDIV